jgi:hypothetical protein
MVLSDTARRILTKATQHPLRLAAPPAKLPAAACRAVLNSFLKQGYVEECAAPMEYIGLGWRQPDGAWTAVRVTEAGMAAIGAVPATTTALDEAELGGLTQAEYDAEQDAAQRALDAGINLTALDAHEQAVAAGIVPADPAQEPGSMPLAAQAAAKALVAPTGADAAQAPSTRATLRDAAHRVLAAWNDEANQRAGLAEAIAALSTILVKPAPAARVSGPRKPREGTKQQQVLAMLRRPEGTTVAQIASATGWQIVSVVLTSPCEMPCC